MLAGKLWGNPFSQNESPRSRGKALLSRGKACPQALCVLNSEEPGDSTSESN